MQIYFCVFEIMNTSKQKLNTLRNALTDYETQIELEQLTTMNFVNCEEERRAIAEWMLKSSFNIWVEIDLNYERTKNLSVYEKQRKLKEILSITLNIMDRVFYGHKADRKNERGTRFTFTHFGRSGLNEHKHMLVRSDRRVDFTTYCALLQNIFRHMFDETTDKCSASALRESREHAARYTTHEYNKLGNDTLDLETTNIGNDNYGTELNDDTKRRIGRLKMKLLRRALGTNLKQLKKEELLEKHAM